MNLKKLVLFALFLVSLSGIFTMADGQISIEYIPSNTIQKADSLFNFRDDYKGAELHYKKALDALDPEDWQSKAYCLIKLSNIYTSLYEFSEAEKYLTRANDIIDKHLNAGNPVIAEYHCYSGKFLLRKKMYDSALFHLDRSIELKRKLPGNNNLSLAESLFFKAELYKDGFEIQSKAEEIYREIIDLYNSIYSSENSLYGRVYSSLASCLREQFDFSNAIEYGKRSVQLFRRDSIINRNRLATAIVILANVYMNYGDYTNPLPYFLQLLNQIDNTDDINYYTWFTYYGLAQCYYNSQKFEKAKYYLDRNTALIKSENLGLAFLAFQYLLYGDFFIKKNDPDQAKRYLFMAKKYYDTELTHEVKDATDCYTKIGDYYMVSDDYDSALIFYQKAMIKLIGDFSNEDVFSNPSTYSNPDKRDLYDILYRKGAAFKKKFDEEDDIKYLKAALEIYKLIDVLNDRTRNSRLKDASLLLLSEYYRNEYEKAIETAYLLYDRTRDAVYLKDGFLLMEKSKYMMIFRALTLAEKSRSLDLPYSIKFMEDSLRMLNVQYTTLLNLEQEKPDPDESKIPELEEKIFKTEKALDELRINISEKFPEYYEIKYDSLTRNLDDLSAYCKEYDIMAVEYFWGEKAIYRIATDGSKHFFNRIQRTEELNKILFTLAKELSGEQDYLDASYRSYITNAHEAYRILLGNLYERSDDTDLLIIPDGLLAQLPFEALLSEPGDSSYTDYSALAYLIKKATIAYAYSANLLLNERKTGKETRRDLLAFSYSDINALTETKVRSSGEELPRSAVELNAIKKVLKGKNQYFYAEKATEYQFKQQAPGYRLLHLAVHGYADTTSAHNSRLVFKHDQDSVDDGTLYIHELYGLDLSGTELAVLSACETGIGKEFSGEGVFSMARGFAYAGCPAIVMSLWKVSDTFTSEMMRDFYSELKRGKTTKEALRNAKLVFLKEHNEYQAHPANWASFVFAGRDDQFFKKRRDIRLIIITSFLIIILIIIFYRRLLFS